MSLDKKSSKPFPPIFFSQEACSINLTDSLLKLGNYICNSCFSFALAFQKVTGVSFQEYGTFEQVVQWLRENVIEGVQGLYP